MPKTHTFKTGRVLVGDCLDRLKDLPDASIDAVVTDPPYLISFMSKKWDSEDGAAGKPEVWAECLRVLKPGGHLLAFGATRTYHRMAVAIEDAGFEIRDSLSWSYGSGFPKSLDVSKAIDKKRHDKQDVYKVTAWIRETRDAKGLSNKDLDAPFGFAGMAGHWTSGKSQPAVPTLDQVPTILKVLGVKDTEVPKEIRRLIWDLNGKKGQPGENWAKREVVGKHPSPAGSKGNTFPLGQECDITAPATSDAETWQGWGTALKPSHEPIVMARKPLIGTVADNVLEHGTGALNIDGSRVGSETVGWYGAPGFSNLTDTKTTLVKGGDARPVDGRWPANTILTHHADCQQVGSKAETVTTTNGKPSHEPIVMARKPLTGTVADNVLEHGTGALNIDGTRVGMKEGDGWDVPVPDTNVVNPARSLLANGTATEDIVWTDKRQTPHAAGRWPANTILTHAADCQQVGSKSETMTGGFGNGGIGMAETGQDGDAGKGAEWQDKETSTPVYECAEGCPVPVLDEQGEGASRFFKQTEWDPELDAAFIYIPKPSKKEKNAGLDDPNSHPTVKPVALMRYLIKLITPPGGTILDPFLGSGTTAVAAILEGHEWVGVEYTPEYLPIIKGRVQHAQEQAEAEKPQPQQLDLLDEGA